VALTGTAVGAAFITKKKAKNIANNQITKRAPGLTVASANQLTRVTVQTESIQTGANSSNAVAAVCPSGQKGLGVLPHHVMNS
jgi:hypothetical protein